MSNISSIMDNKIKNTALNLEKNNIATYIVEKKCDVVSLIETLIKEGDIISSGGSMSLKECGVYEFLKNGRYTYLDRDAEGLTRDEINEIYIKTFSADTYLCSSNAVTEKGELYNVDGNSNRVAAICYGPKSVIMVVGYNKIVKNIDEAIKRVKTIAAPKNCDRLNIDSYCRLKGECVSLSNENSDICSGCNSDTRICCNYVISARQRHVNRIKVILVCEELGY